MAVLINKAMIEIPPKFAGRPAVNPEAQKVALTAKDWKGAAGLAEDVRYYGQWMRDEAERRIGHLYPRVLVTHDMAAKRPDLKRYAGRELTVIAWLWARTVRSPNPAFTGMEVPLVSNFMLSTKKGREAWVEPVIEGKDYRFEVRVGSPPDVEVAKKGTKIGRGNFRCLLSGSPVPYSYIDDEANAGRMGARLLAIVAAGDRQRLYLAPDSETETVAHSARPSWKPDLPSRGTWASNAQGRRYGFHTFGDYFTPRQLTALTTFMELVGAVRERAQQDAIAAEKGTGGVDARPLREGGSGPAAYGGAVSLYLACSLSKMADRGSSICTWFTERDSTRSTFARQSLPMTWDYAELNPLLHGTGSFLGAASWTAESMDTLGHAPGTPGRVSQADVRNQNIGTQKIVSTDPPYYDNIGYADLSDFFYVWLRRSLLPLYPDLFSTLAVPKSGELVAALHRHGSKQDAERFFLDGMTNAMRRIAEQTHPAFPVTIYYAFKQAEKEDAGVVRTGWETFLGAVIAAGMGVGGTWPVRTELSNRMVGMGANALASSVVLVCRSHPPGRQNATWREFVDALKRDLPRAVIEMQRAGIEPVDLAQAAIGPGMAIFTRYAEVLYSSGERMTVAEALALINQVLDETLAEQEGELDADTRWALAWFAQHHFDKADFGIAETLSTAKNTSVEGLVEAGILEASRGRVRLLKPEELPDDWDPATDRRLTVWEMVHHLIRVLDAEGEAAAGQLLRKIGAQGEIARALAHRLYALCDRQKRPADALRYNTLVRSWPELKRLAEHDGGRPQPLL